MSDTQMADSAHTNTNGHTSDNTAAFSSSSTAMTDTAASSSSPSSASPASAPVASPELLRLQARVASHAQDFDAWCSLVSESEKTRDPDLIRIALNGLLEQFPLCFGYWQRLARHEGAVQQGVALTGGAPPTNVIADTQTIEHGIDAVPHSHELWTFYVTNEMSKEQVNVEEVRSVFLRGSSTLSTDSGASLFWDKYLEFELTQFASPAIQAQLQLLPPPYTGTLIGGVYALILSLPLRDIEKFWLSFSQKFAVNYPLNYLASPQEAELYTSDYPKEIPEARRTMEPTLTLTQYLNEWELEQRRLLLVKREQSFRISVALRDEKYAYERDITRTYFHVAPLTPHELTIWNAYLDFMEAKLMRTFVAQHGTNIEPTAERMDQLLLNDTIKVYERCIIPAASYADMWDRYAHFLAQLNEPLRAIEVRQRALVFLQRNVVASATGAGVAAVQECMIALGELEERQNRVEVARKWYAQALHPAPVNSAAEAAPLLEAHLAMIHFERRQWLQAHPAATKFEATSKLVELYTTAIATLNPTKHGLQHAKACTYVTMAYAQFTLEEVLFVSDEERVRAVRAIFESAASYMTPEPITTTQEVPGTAGADGIPGAATTVTHTNVPRLVASRQYLLFWLAYIEFEASVARSSFDVITALFDRALCKKLVVSTAVLLANPHVGIGGASGLSDVSRRALWQAYQAYVETHATNLNQLEKVKREAKLAALATSTTTPPLLSVLGKRRQAAVSPTPIQQTASKIARPPPAQPVQRYAQQPYQAATSAYGYGGAATATTAYQGYAPQAVASTADYYAHQYPAQ